MFVPLFYTAFPLQRANALSQLNYINVEIHTFTAAQVSFDSPFSISPTPHASPFNTPYATPHTLLFSIPHAIPHVPLYITPQPPPHTPFNPTPITTHMSNSKGVFRNTTNTAPPTTSYTTPIFATPSFKYKHRPLTSDSLMQESALDLIQEHAGTRCTGGNSSLTFVERLHSCHNQTSNIPRFHQTKATPIPTTG